MNKKINDTKSKIFKVISIPTGKADIRGQLVIHDGEKMSIASCHQGKKFNHRQAYNLYFISGEEIESGDCMTDGFEVYKNKIKLDWYIGIYKIEATTDKSLYNKKPENCKPKKEKCIDIHCTCNQVPQIPQSFVNDYAKKNGKIYEVEVEIENSKIKKNKDDGTIVIKKYK